MINATTPRYNPLTAQAADRVRQKIAAMSPSRVDTVAGTHDVLAYQNAGEHLARATSAAAYDRKWIQEKKDDQALRATAVAVGAACTVGGFGVATLAAVGSVAPVIGVIVGIIGLCMLVAGAMHWLVNNRDYSSEEADRQVAKAHHDQVDAYEQMKRTKDELAERATSSPLIACASADVASSTLRQLAESPDFDSTLRVHRQKVETFPLTQCTASSPAFNDAWLQSRSDAERAWLRRVNDSKLEGLLAWPRDDEAGIKRSDEALTMRERLEGKMWELPTNLVTIEHAWRLHQETSVHVPPSFFAANATSDGARAFRAAFERVKTDADLTALIALVKQHKDTSLAAKLNAFKQK